MCFLVGFNNSITPWDKPLDYWPSDDAVLSIHLLFLLCWTWSWATHSHLAHSGKSFPPPWQPVSLSPFVRSNAAYKSAEHAGEKPADSVHWYLYPNMQIHVHTQMCATPFCRVRYTESQRQRDKWCVREIEEGKCVFHDPSSNERSLRGLSVSAWPELFTLI